MAFQYQGCKSKVNKYSLLNKTHYIIIKKKHIKDEKIHYFFSDSLYNFY